MKSHSIVIDAEVYAELAERAPPFWSANRVLRSLLGLPDKRPGRRPTKQKPVNADRKGGKR